METLLQETAQCGGQFSSKKDGLERESSLDRLMSASVVRILPVPGGLSVRKDGRTEERAAIPELDFCPKCPSPGESKLG